MKFKLFNVQEEYLHDLYPILANNKEVLNGEDYLSLTLKLDLKILNKYRILAWIETEKIWKEFIVEEVDEDRDLGIVEIYAENSFYETIGDYIEDSRAINTDIVDALNKALAPTRWEKGQIDSFGKASCYMYRTNAKEKIQEIAINWKAELRTRIEIVGNRITHRYIDMLNKRGDFLGERFVTTDNLNKIKRNINTENLATALYGFGKGEELEGEEGDPTGGFGRRIDFSSINNGKMYVEDNEAKNLWGRLNRDGTKSHIFKKVEYDGVEEIEEVLKLTKEDLEIMKNPSVIYEGDIIGSVARLGDTVILIDETYEPQIRVTARVYELDNDLLVPGNSKPVLGNYVSRITDDWNKQDEYVDKFRGKSGIWDRADKFDKDGTLNSKFLTNLLNEFNEKANETGGHVFIEDGEGLITTDYPTVELSTMAVQIKGGLIRIAHQKLANGNWDWTTALDGKGITAAVVNTGVLRGGNVEFDLDNGTLHVMDGAFRLTNGNGTVVIDGQSNMFKIHTTIDLSLNAKNNPNFSYSVQHGLGFVPAFIGFQVDTPSNISGNTHLPAYGIGEDSEGNYVITSAIRATVDDQNIKIQYQRARLQNSPSSFKVRIFVYKEALI